MLQAPSALNGLTSKQAQERLVQQGPKNSLATNSAVPSPCCPKCYANRCSYYCWGGSIYLLLGDVHEALMMMLLFFVAVVVGITLYEDQKTEGVLQALRELSRPREIVARNCEK